MSREIRYELSKKHHIYPAADRRIKQARATDKMVKSRARHYPTTGLALHIRKQMVKFRTKKDRGMELISVKHECAPGQRKIAVKRVGIFGNDTMKILEVTV